VDPFGGTGSTNNQTKQYNGQCAIDCDWVGGDYDLWAYLQLVDNTTVSYKKLVNDGYDVPVRFDRPCSHRNCRTLES